MFGLSFGIHYLLVFLPYICVNVFICCCLYLKKIEKMYLFCIFHAGCGLLILTNFFIIYLFIYLSDFGPFGYFSLMSIFPTII